MRAKLAFTGATVGTSIGYVALICSETQSAYQIALVSVGLLAEIAIGTTALLSFKAGEAAWHERAMAATALFISLTAILLLSQFAYGMTQYQAHS